MTRWRGPPWLRAGGRDPAAALTRPASRDGRMTAALTIGVLWLVGAFCGLVIALGAKQLTVLAFGLVGGLLLLVSPIELLLWILVLMTILIVGPVTYFGGIQQATWAPSMIAGFLLLRVPVEWLAARSANRGVALRSGSASMLMPLLALYIALLLMSAVFNIPRLGQAIVATKAYLPFWSVLLLLAAAQSSPDTLRRIWWGLLALALIQLPFAILEHLVFASRMRASAWDAVVGTFPGNPDGGGSSGALALFLVSGMVLVMALRKHALLDKGLAALMLIALLACVVLAEVKVVFVLIPLGIGMLYWREIAQRPVQGLAFVSIGACLLLALMFIYQALYWESATRSSLSFQEALGYMFWNQVDPDNLNRRTGEMGRLASLVFWGREVLLRDVFHALAGFGPAASRVSATMGMGPAAAKYPFGLDTSTLSVLLWDGGLLTCTTFVALVAVGARASARLAREAAIPVFHRAVLQAGAIMLLLVLATLAYNRDAVDNSPIQLLLAWLLGQAAYWQAMLRRAAPVAPQRPVVARPLARVTA